MTLSLLGRESLDELEGLAMEYFSPIKNLNLVMPWHDYSPDSPDSSNAVTPTPTPTQTALSAKNFGWIYLNRPKECAATCK